MPKYKVNVTGPNDAADVTHLTVDTDIANGSSVKTAASDINANAAAVSDEPSATNLAARKKLSQTAANAAKSRLVSQNALEYRRERDENIVAQAANNAIRNGKLWTSNKKKNILNLQNRKRQNATLREEQKTQKAAVSATNIAQKMNAAEAHRIEMNTAKGVANAAYLEAQQAAQSAEESARLADASAQEAENIVKTAENNPAMAKMSGQHTINKVERAEKLRGVAKTALSRKLASNLQLSTTKMEADLAAARLEEANKKKFVIDAIKKKIMTRKAAISAQFNSKDKNALVKAATNAVNEVRLAEEAARQAALKVEKLYRQTPKGLANERGAYRRATRSNTVQALSNSQIQIAMDNNTGTRNASSTAAAVDQMQNETIPVQSTFTRGGGRRTHRKHAKKTNKSKKRK